MSNSKQFVMASEVAMEELGDGLSRQVLGFNDDLMLVKVWFKPGAEGYVHKHHNAQVSYVVEGQFEVNIDGKIKTLSAGDSFYVPPSVEHGAICHTGGILIDTFSPAREDFLK